MANKCSQCRKTNQELLTRWERFKNWLFNSLFKHDVIDLSQDKYTQGFSDGWLAGHEQKTKNQPIHEIEDLANKMVSDLLGFVDEKKVITMNEKQGAIFLGGERITPEECVNLKQEAELILTTDLWKIFNNTIRDIANKTMFEKSESFDDMKSGKCFLYNLSLQNKILNMFKNYVKK